MRAASPADSYPLAAIVHDRWVWASLLCVALVCIPLVLINPGSDWTNHVWMIDYQARFFAHHGFFTSQLNTDQIAGMSFPIFYGYLFFPLMGVLSTVLSANMTLRLMVVGLLWLQFFLIYKTSAQWTGNRFFAFTLGTLAVWSIYPLTNLYNRGAIPEFFACGLLNCACLTLFQALRAATRRQLWTWSNFSVLCLCACAGTHPITALFGVPFYALLVGIGMAVHRRQSARLLLALLVPSLIATTCLAPWVVATARYNKSLDIAYSFREVSYYPKSIDGWQLRLCPIPIPIYNLRHKALDEHMGTPGLDAEINMPMLVLFLFVLAGLIRQKRLRPGVIVSCVGLLLLAGWLLYLSSTQHSLDKFGYCVGAIQFAYRMVTYINLAIFSALLLAVSQSLAVSSAVDSTTAGAAHAAAALEQASSETAAASALSASLHKEGGAQSVGTYAGTASSLKEGLAPLETVIGSSTRARASSCASPQLLAFLLVAGFVAMLFKLHATQKLDPIAFKMWSSQMSDSDILRLSFGFYGHPNYMVTGANEFLPDRDGSHLPAFPLLPGRGKDFGIVQPVKVKDNQQGWIITNVQPFVWNGLSLNNRPLAQKTGLALRSVTVLPERPLDQARSICIKDLPAGTLQFDFKPDVDWAALNRVALPLYLLWFGSTAIFSIAVGFIPCKSRSAAPGAATN